MEVQSTEVGNDPEDLEDRLEMAESELLDRQDGFPAEKHRSGLALKTLKAERGVELLFGLQLGVTEGDKETA